MYNTVKLVILSWDTQEPTDAEGSLPRASLTWRKQTPWETSALSPLSLTGKKRMSTPQRGLCQDVTLAPALSTPAMTYKATFWPPITHQSWVLNPGALFPWNLGRQDVKMKRTTVHKYIDLAEPDFTSVQENPESGVGRVVFANIYNYTWNKTV